MLQPSRDILVIWSKDPRMAGARFNNINIIGSWDQIVLSQNIKNNNTGEMENQISKAKIHEKCQ